MEENQTEDKTNEDNQSQGFIVWNKPSKNTKTTEELIASTHFKVNIILFIMIASICLAVIQYVRLINALDGPGDDASGEATEEADYDGTDGGSDGGNSDGYYEDYYYN